MKQTKAGTLIISSEKVKIICEVWIWLNLVFLSVVTDLVGVHANHRDLDGTHEVEVVVAEMIGRSLEVNLIKAAGIVCDSVQDWLSCTLHDFMRDQKEVEFSIALLLD